MQIHAHDLENPLLRMLAFAAVEPGLRNILVLNTSMAQLLIIDNVLGQMLVAAGESVAPPHPAHILSTYDGEDALWGSAMLLMGRNRQRLRWQRGILPVEKRGPVRRLIIPDLSQASLSVFRACTVAAGAEVVHVERHGRRVAGAPNFVWLAGCAVADLGKVSPHLLDRFSFRFALADPPIGNDSSRIQRLLKSLRSANPRLLDTERVDLDSALAAQLAAAARSAPALTPAALELLIQQNVPGESIRRVVVLGRMAVAAARLAGAAAVEPEYVEQAARLFGLTAEQPGPDRPREKPFDEESESDGALAEYFLPQGQMPELSPRQGQKASPSDATLELVPQMLEATASELFAEDSAPPERPVDPLRVPVGRKRNSAYVRGPAIGVEPTTSVSDLSITGSLLEAAKYQPIRRRQPGRVGSMVILPCDLRRHRRAPAPDQALVLLVDYTALHIEDWPQRLMPLLQWAYAQRAGVHLIRVGARDALHELCADQMSFRSVLARHFAPRLFQTSAGRATPLAHGLALAHQILQHWLQSGRSNLVEARLVVFSDGRGNVPLSASIENRITAAAGRQGVADAIAIAKQIASIKRVESYVVDLEPPHRREYQQMLADALSARMYRSWAP